MGHRLRQGIALFSVRIEFWRSTGFEFSVIVTGSISFTDLLLNHFFGKRVSRQTGPKPVGLFS